MPMTPSHVRPNLTDVAHVQTKVAELEGKLRDIEIRQVALDAELRLVHTRVSEQREGRTFRVARSTLIYTIVILVVTVAIGILASDWIRKGLSDFLLGPSDQSAPVHLPKPTDTETPSPPSTDPPTK